MDKETRNRIQHATQQARSLLEDELKAQLEGIYDIRPDGTVAAHPGHHLAENQEALRVRKKLVEALAHLRAERSSDREAVAALVRECAFTTLNRFVALKLVEARKLVQPCVSQGLESAGFKEFLGLAEGLKVQPDAAYRLYLECLFDELGREVRVLFDRRDPASLVWPRRPALLKLLELLNDPELAPVWAEDETLGWVYQFFNSGEERALMRDTKRGGSASPRNRRELAVRNQFFTPRYVVRFLVDNTLGRMWREMAGEDTGLLAQCAYFVQGTELHDRPRKDPRALRILDPACGSGHFLLYCFDLLLTIYEEAWQAGDLRDECPDLATLKRLAPRFIVEHNLYGVDIDPRCAQIAAFALWLRAQRAWAEQGLPAGQRPAIRRTGIVVAEPMPGDPALVEAFAAGLESPGLGALFRAMIEELRLAGEMGSLLRVEKGIATALGKARTEMRRPALPGLGAADDAAILEANVESRLLDALRSFAETAGAGTMRRRLFAGDAAQGVALIELLQQRFDVVLMNPPFGAGSMVAKVAFEKAYPRTKNDVYAAFVERGIELLHSRGLLGALTSRTGFFLSSFQKWREEVLLQEAPPVVFADLGYGVLDSAMVEVAAYCLEKGRGGGETTFLRVLEVEAKEEALQGSGLGVRGSVYSVNPASFAAMPRSPFAYWVRDVVRQLFLRFPALGSEGRTAASGGKTLDDFRWIRATWEANSGRSWVGFAKGGSFSPFYSDVHLLLDWQEEGQALKEYLVNYRSSRGWSPNWTAELHSSDYYFRPGLTWPRRTDGLSLRVMPAGCIFADKGPAAFVENDDCEELLSLVAVTNSAPFGLLVTLQLARTELAQSYEVGVIQRTPVPRLTEADRTVLADLAQHAWSLKRTLDTRTETSHAFILPALLQVAGESLTTRAGVWAEHVAAIEAELATIQAEIDEQCFTLYGIDKADRGTLVVPDADPNPEPGTPNPEDDESEEDPPEAAADPTALVAELISWAIGVAFGRFDLRLATGERPLPSEPEPFDPLPVRSPGMVPEDHPTPSPAILVDDPGHPRDLTTAVRAVFEAVFGPEAEARWQEAAALLDPKGHDLRAWIHRDFFAFHLKRYSKSRRKAPIYWQLGTGRVSYWLYAHRATRDSLLQLQDELLTPRLLLEERRLDEAPDATPTDRRRRAEQATLVGELRTLQTEVKRAMPLWHPDLDDGIVLTLAPLRRLIPHKPWQKELQSKWDELEAGRYDWAHLAMHLWPDRVVPKCTTDRSLAIAHGLEAELWQEDAQGKWQPIPKSEAEIAALIQARTAAGTREALRAPAPEPPTPAPKAEKPKKAARDKAADQLAFDLAASPPQSSTPEVQPVQELPDGAWRRPEASAEDLTFVQLVALMKATSEPTPKPLVRLAATLALEPRLLTPFLQEEQAEWRRRIGPEADPLGAGVVPFRPRVDQAWGTAVTKLQGMRALIDDRKADTWVAGAKLSGLLEVFSPSEVQWAEGRANMVWDALRRIGSAEFIKRLSSEHQEWIRAAA